MKMLLLSTMYMCIYDMLMFMGWFMCYATFDKYLLWQVRMRSTRKPDSAQAGLIWYLPLLFLSKTPPAERWTAIMGRRGTNNISIETLYSLRISLFDHIVYVLLVQSSFPLSRVYASNHVYILDFFPLKDIQLFDLHTVLKRICFYRKITRWYDSCQ